LLGARLVTDYPDHGRSCGQLLAINVAEPSLLITGNDGSAGGATSRQPLADLMHTGYTYSVSTRRT